MMLSKYIKKIEPIIEEVNGKRVEEINGVIMPEYLYSFPDGIWLSLELDQIDHYFDVKLGRLFSFEDVMPRLIVLERIEYYFPALNELKLGNIQFDFSHNSYEMGNVFEILKNYLKTIIENYQQLKEYDKTQNFILKEERRLKSYLLVDLSNSTNLELDLKDRIDAFNNRINKTNSNKMINRADKIKFDKWIGRIFIASAIAMVLIAVILCVYYNVINKDQKESMDLWAVILLCITFATFAISGIMIDLKKIKFDDSLNEKGIVKKISKVLEELFAVIAMLLLFPIILIFSIVETTLNTPNKKTFKTLIDKGFTYSYKNKMYTLKKNEIIIEILSNLTDYYISFDNGENFVRIEESNLGTSYERNELKFRLNEYIFAHPVDKQRGDAIPPLEYFVEFLTSNLDSLNNQIEWSQNRHKKLK